MNDRSSGTALIIGVGDGLSASLARLLSREGYRLVLVARDTGKLADLAKETKADARRCDASDPQRGRGAVPGDRPARGDDLQSVLSYSRAL